jgi:hypothetical protein
MLFQYRYFGQTHVHGSSSETTMNFAPDTLRSPVHFRGLLSKHLPFREAISALHSVVVSDLRFTPKDQSQYREWLQTQEQAMLVEAMANLGGVTSRVSELRQEIDLMNQERAKILGPYDKAKIAYFKHLYEQDREAWYVLDPVITVHPDELSFECFSQDESSYGRLACSHNVFKDSGEFMCGTTNVDYSHTLYNEFQKIRDYKETRLDIDATGFTVQTGMDADYNEVKIDLPDSWVRGFLQVSSAMTLPGYHFDLHPLDLQNFFFILRRYKEKKGPRSMKFLLQPGEPVRVVFEPWNHEISCPRSIYYGPSSAEIRIWGRRRLLILERLLSATKRFHVTLLGSGMPSFFLADMGDMTFTLGLSGWTANDWSRSGNFDLMAPRGICSDEDKIRVFQALQQSWYESAGSIASRLSLSEATASSALSAWCQAGRVMFDVKNQVYRVRELSREPLPMEQLRFANEREQASQEMLHKAQIQGSIHADADGIRRMNGKVKTHQLFDVTLFIDADERLINGRCTCNFYRQNKLHLGPCEHMLALRMKLQNSLYTTP